MKKLMLIVTLALVSLCVSAQDGLKGTWFVGGQLSYNQTKTGDAKVNNTMVLPIVGAFVTPDVAIGAGLGYIGGEGYADEKDGGYKIKSNSFVFKPLVRKYWNISGGLFFYGQAALPMIFGKTGPSGAKASTTSVGLELSPGFDYVVNSWMTIETSFRLFNLGYSRVKPKEGDATTGFDINANPFNSIDDREIGKLQIGVKFLF